MPHRQNGDTELINDIRQAKHDISLEPEGAASILRSVQAQEAQFEELTRQLEFEKKRVADQLEQSAYVDDSSLRSISESNDSFSWRRSGQDESHLGDETETELSAHLLDSCLRELEEKQLMDPNDHMTSFQYPNPGMDNSHFSNGQDSDYMRDNYMAMNGSDDYARVPEGQMGSVQRHNRDFDGHHGSTGSLPRSIDDYTASPAHHPHMDDYHHPYDREDYGSRGDYEPHRDYEPQPDYRNPPPDGYIDDRYGRHSPDYVSGSQLQHPGYSYNGPPSPVGSDRFRQPPGRYGDDGYMPEEQYGRPGEGYRAPSPQNSERYNERYVGTPPGSYSHAPQFDDQYRDSPTLPRNGNYRHYDTYGPYPAPHSAAVDQIWDMLPDEDPYQSGAYDPDTMDSAPLASMDPRDSQDNLVFPHSEKGLRAPDLQEVIEYLGHSNQAIVANAAAYLQHLTYGDDGLKNKTRGLGGIPALVNLITHDNQEISRSVCGALRNISYGKANKDNKIAIKNANGIPNLVRQMRNTEDPEILEMVTGTLWNLSSTDVLKKPIIDDGLTVLTKRIVIPHSGWKGNVRDVRSMDAQWSTIFKNTSGCLRNVSSADTDTRKKMRECEGFVDSFYYVLLVATQSNEMDNKVVENAACILRNLSFRIAYEANHPDALPDKTLKKDGTMKKPAPKDAKKAGCFPSTKKNSKDGGKTGTLTKSGTLSKQSHDQYLEFPERKTPAKGAELLWQPEVIKPYLLILSNCSNPVTLEASAGTLQNISAGEWRWAGYIRASVRKEKGLPVLVELLRMDKERVVKAVALALRNLSMDPRNKELIGKYAMRDLVSRLPGGGVNDTKLSDESTLAILTALQEVISKNMENAKSLRDASGIERLVTISKSKKYPANVVKAANQVLFTMWGFRDLRALYKKDGWEETVFNPMGLKTGTLPKSATGPKTQAARQASAPVGARPDEPTSTTNPNYSDSTIGSKYGGPPTDEGPPPIGQDDHRGREHHRYPSGDEHIGMQDLNYSSVDNNSFKQPAGSVPMYGMTRENMTPTSPNREPVYAKVDKEKKNRYRQSLTDNYDNTPESQHATSIQLNGPGDDPNIDSWV
ncbi:catenin delta-2-like isoform X2 [Anneissia japonica]|uniref:catenin delta-2-like isoform X2 n=1 Tax=Anneissia japonica TaxID=1529436 RepID=UPI001425B08B|nr:catenin delta-2-like isoform X2 [Anneissia japonica]